VRHHGDCKLHELGTPLLPGDRARSRWSASAEGCYTCRQLRAGP